MMTKVLVAGLDDKSGGPLRQIVLDAVPKTYVTFFMDSQNALGMMHVVDLVICAHPEVLRLLSSRHETDKGWWNTDFNCWFYSTNRHTLEADMKDFDSVLKLMDAFVPG
jgi:hypothetical protein